MHIKMAATTPGLLQVIAERMGLPVPVLKLAVCVFGSYVMAFLYRRHIMIKDPWIQHMYFTVSGVGIALFCFGYGCIHSIVNVLLAFLVLRLGGPTILTVILMFILNMVYLVTGYVYMNVEDNLHFHWTTTHCVLCLRLTGLAWDYYDGAQKSLNDDYKTTAIHSAPSLQQILGYVYFYGGFLVGPQFAFKRYLVFVEGDMKQSRKDDLTCVSAGAHRLALGALYAMMFLILEIFINADYLLSDWYESRPLLVKYLYVAMFGKVGFMKYIGLFLLAEGSCIVSGLSFNGVDSNGNLKWDGTCYVKLWEYETSLNCQHMIDSFNIPTNLWIRRYLFKRLRPLGSRTISYVATLLFLSIWHGVDVGFFIAFLFQFLLVNMEKQAGGLWQMLFPDKGLSEVPLYTGLPAYAVCIVYRHIIFPFAFAPFVLLEWQKIYKFYAATYRVSPIMAILIWPLLYPLVILPLVKRVAGKHKKEE